MKSLLVLTAIFSFSLPAQAAEVENPNFLPFGEQEAFLGNAGIALEDSSGAVFYNPGSLGFVSNRKISVYGNAYTFNRSNFHQEIAINQPELLVSANSSSSVPLSSVTVFGSGSWTYAFSLNTPYTFQSEASLPYQSQSFEAKVSQDTSENSLWIGPSLARTVSEDISIGMSLFAARYSRSVNSISYQRESKNDTTTTAAMRVTSNDWSVLMILGAQWRIKPTWTAGLRIQSASLDLRGRTEYFLTNQKNGTSPLSTMQAEQGIYSRFRRPFNFGIGTKYSLGNRLAFLFDLNAQLPIHYNVVPSRAAINTRVDTKLTPRMNLGAKWQMAPTHNLLFGFLYNPSTVAGSENGSLDDIHENFKGISLGLQNDMGSLISSVGGFYLWASASQTLAGTDFHRSFTHEIFGLLLTASYKL